MRRQSIVFLALFMFVTELALQTVGLNAHNYIANAFFHVVASVIIGLLAINQSFKTPVAGSAIKSGPNYRLALAWVFIPFFLFCLSLYRIFGDFALKEEVSDIMPMIRTLNERLLSGEYPYKMVNKWGYDFFPTFLPAHWAPFSISFIFHFDMRWVSSFAWAIVVMIIAAYHFSGSARISAWKWFLPGLLFLVPALYVIYDPISLGVSAELLITAYYLLLILAIWTRNLTLLAIATVLCLLSRYSLVLFAPVLVLILYQQYGKKELLRYILIVLGGILAFYVIPFMWKDPLIFYKSYHYYSTSSISEWHGQPWQEPGSKPYTLFRGIGLASLVYDYGGGTLDYRIVLDRMLHLGFLLGTSVLLCLQFWLMRHKIRTPELFTLGAFKIYLTVFYAWIQIPYSYLYIMPASISALLVMILWQTTKPATEETS